LSFAPESTKAAPDGTDFSYSASIPDVSSTPGSSRESVYRTRNSRASPYQRDAACSLTGNIVRNPDFAQGSDGTVTGWETDSSDPNITFNSVSAPDGKGTVAQFKSAAAGRELVVKQSMTLCPGKKYQFSISTQQAKKLASCSVTSTLVYADGTRVQILSVEPEEKWTPSNASITAGKQAEADLECLVKCAGFQGMPVSAQEDEGWMTVNVQKVSLVRE
jgi:hypothetical protein